MAVTGRMDKQTVAYPYGGMSPSLNVRGNSNARYTWMNLEDITLNDVSQIHRTNVIRFHLDTYRRSAVTESRLWGSSLTGFGLG